MQPLGTPGHQYIRWILQSFFNSLVSTIYILALMMLIIFLYAVVGIQLFGTNDPWHFGSLHESMITLFRVATLDDWETIMRINVYGCDTNSVEEYPGDNVIDESKHCQVSTFVT
jgi:hypothetical protein